GGCGLCSRLADVDGEALVEGEAGGRLTRRAAGYDAEADRLRLRAEARRISWSPGSRREPSRSRIRELFGFYTFVGESQTNNGNRRRSDALRRSSRHSIGYPLLRSAFSSEIAGAALVDDRLPRHTRLGQQRREASHAEAGSQEACPVRRVRRRHERVCSITVERRPGVRERLLRPTNRQR